MTEQDEVVELTNKIIDGLGEVDLKTGLTVVCNLAGQLVCAIAEGNPSLVNLHTDIAMHNVKQAALAKMIHDADAEREEEVGG